MVRLRDRGYDYTILVVTTVLVMLGIVMVFSASFYNAENSPQYNDGFYFFKKQIFGAVVGLAAMIVMMLIDYNKLGKLKILGILFSLILLGLVYVPGVGVEINGSSRWINLGFTTLQPSEVAKFFLVVCIAKILDDNQNQVQKFKYGVLPILVVVGLICLAIIPQPNYSAILIICILSFVLMLVGGVKIGYLLGFLTVAGAGGAYALVTQDHIRVRMFAFLTPELDPLGKGYQILQSLYAIGSGGAFGRGIGNSMQKFLYLPYGESDFIFSILCEELGFIGALLLIVLFVILIYRGIRTAIKAPNVFGMLLATGIIMMIAIQVLLNIAVATRSIPPTGVSLPFISAGSTALITFMAEIGILLNISHQGNKA
jgi:cell division protein FtsW